MSVKMVVTFRKRATKAELIAKHNRKVGKITSGYDMYMHALYCEFKGCISAAYYRDLNVRLMWNRSKGRHYRNRKAKANG